MSVIIDNIAKAILYKGPTIDEIIMNAMKNQSEFDVINNNSTTNVMIKSIMAYNVEVIDNYIYDSSSSLIKHIVKVNNKEKVVFDKYKSIRHMTSKLKYLNSIAS